MRRIVVLCEGGNDCPGRACARLTGEGRCELALESEGEVRVFQCSLSSLINVGLGARTHLASDFGACALARKPGGVKITVTPWGEVPRKYMVPLDIYAEALTQLSEAEVVQKRVSLL